jgi:large subunit ribosomal protein L21
MFAIVRTGGKQYRVAADQKIIVDRMPGEAGDSIALDDVLLLSDGTAVAGQSVAAEIVAQIKGDKIIIFKKKRRHNYRRKNGHRQLLTLLKITAVGGEAPKAMKAAAPKAEAAPAVDAAPVVKPAKKAAAPKAEAVAEAAPKKTAKPKAAKAAPAAE